MGGGADVAGLDGITAPTGEPGGGDVVWGAGPDACGNGAAGATGASKSSRVSGGREVGPPLAGSRSRSASLLVGAAGAALSVGIQWVAAGLSSFTGAAKESAAGSVLRATIRRAGGGAP